MEDDLETIANKTERALATRPSQYDTQLKLFGSFDERVLGEFLRLEDEEKPHYLKYKGWDSFFGNQERYSNPVKYMEEEREIIPEMEKHLEDTNNLGLSEFGVSQGTVAVLALTPNIARRRLDMKTKLYESIVAYAKQIALEEGIEPIGVVQNSELRDEIYRRIFPIREMFEWYHNTKSQLAIIVMGAVYNTLEQFIPLLKEAENNPNLSPGDKEVLNKFKNTPPKAVFESFTRDNTASDYMRAGRIYSNPSENSQSAAK